MTPLTLVQRKLRVLEQAQVPEQEQRQERAAQLAQGAGDGCSRATGIVGAGWSRHLRRTFLSRCRCSRKRLNIFDAARAHDLGNTLFTNSETAGALSILIANEDPPEA